MSAATEKFGAFIRRERESKQIGLREMAKKVGVSPTYMSKVSATSSRRQRSGP
jgi:HTH-type transcriptional regulator, competence development regulator